MCSIAVITWATFPTVIRWKMVYLNSNSNIFILDFVVHFYLPQIKLTQTKVLTCTSPKKKIQVRLHDYEFTALMLIVSLASYY